MQPPRSAIPGVRFPALPHAQGSKLLAMQYQLARSQWLSPEALLQHQLAQLKAVLDHACLTVPYYRALFESQRLIVPGSVDLAFLRRIPISACEGVCDAGDALRSERVPAGHSGTKAITSGSTARPVRMLGTGLTDFFRQAFGLRDHLWHGHDFSRKLAVIRRAPKGIAHAPEGARQQSWGRIVDPVFESGPLCLLNVAAPLEEQIAWLLRERPDYLLSYPSNLEALARHCLDQSIGLRFLEVRTIGETLGEEQRALYARAWSCKVVDSYTCEEAGYLALQCPSHGRLHVQSENVFLEIVDEAGRPCPNGEAGRVLITTLHNFATPLVRYELGDYAAFGEPCGCGRGLPVITKIVGRRRNSPMR